MRPNASSHSLALMFPFRQSGFTLIELMIAMTLGLLLLASLVYVYTNSAQSFRAQSALTLIQNNARYAFEIMGVDIRQTGFTGTRKDSVPVNAINISQTSSLCPLTNLFDGTHCTSINSTGPLMGYETDDTTNPSSPPNVCTTANTSPCYQAGTDSLTVVRVDTENKYTVAAHNTGTFTFTLNSWPTSSPPQVGEIFVAADYINAAVFQVSGIDATAKTVSYTAGNPPSPGNDSTQITNVKSLISNAGGLYRLSGVSYYIGTNPAGEPVLYRDKLTHSGTTLNSTAEELIEGVEDMQITYGVDTDTDGDVDAYQDADSVVAWGNVLSVRITLTLVSQQGIKVTTTGAPLSKKFTNTIAIRNRLL